jgi:hypothetical protein
MILAQSVYSPIDLIGFCLAIMQSLHSSGSGGKGHLQGCSHGFFSVVKERSNSCFTLFFMKHLRDYIPRITKFEEHDL